MPLGGLSIVSVAKDGLSLDWRGCYWGLIPVKNPINAAHNESKNPSPDKLLLAQLDLELPPQAPPRITSSRSLETLQN